MTLSVPSPHLVLVAYAESLCRGVRALLVGDARSPLATALVDRGARLVHVCDSDAVRRAEAAARSTQRNVSFGSLDDGPAALRESFFDLAIVENLAREADPRATLAAVSRLLAPRGAALVVAPNPELREGADTGESERPLDYYALYDAAAHAFPHVRMLGQVPFVGYAVVDFAAEGDPSAVLDASLMPPRGEEPEFFVALAGREPRALEEYAVVQLPSSSLRRGAPVTVRPAAPLPEPRASREPSAAETELAAQVKRQEAWIAELELRATAADERADTAETEIEELREKLANQAQVATNDHRATLSERDTLRSDLERARRRTNDLSDLLALKEGELKLKDSELQGKSAELELKKGEVERKASELELEKRELRGKNADLELKTSKLELELRAAAEEALKGDDQDLVRLEAQLVERSQEIRRLEAHLREAERTGRELVRRLTEQAALSPSSGLATRLAEAEAELVTLRWSLELAGSARANGVLG